MKKLISMFARVVCVIAFAMPLTIVTSDMGDVATAPILVPELPIEIEIEVSPAGSLKSVPLWKETVELLEDAQAYECPPNSVECTATTERRPSFLPFGCTDLPAGMIPGVPQCEELPPLRVFDACHNVLTGQPLRMRPDEEIDWNQPGYLFDPDEEVPVKCSVADFNNGLCDPIYTTPDPTPTEFRTPIGILVACPNPGGRDDPFRFGNPCRGAEDGTLVVSNPRGIRRKMPIKLE